MYPNLVARLRIIFLLVFYRFCGVLNILEVLGKDGVSTGLTGVA